MNSSSNKFLVETTPLQKRYNIRLRFFVSLLQLLHPRLLFCKYPDESFTFTILDLTLSACSSCDENPEVPSNVINLIVKQCRHM